MDVYHRDKDGKPAIMEQIAARWDRSGRLRLRLSGIERWKLWISPQTPRLPPTRAGQSRERSYCCLFWPLSHRLWLAPSSPWASTLPPGQLVGVSVAAVSQTPHRSRTNRVEPSHTQHFYLYFPPLLYQTRNSNWQTKWKINCTNQQQIKQKSLLQMFVNCWTKHVFRAM